jgi:hypothetical protein
MSTIIFILRLWRHAQARVTGSTGRVTSARWLGCHTWIQIQPRGGRCGFNCGRLGSWHGLTVHAVLVCRVSGQHSPALPLGTVESIPAITVEVSEGLGY